jgi:hypothetical protein
MPLPHLSVKPLQKKNLQVRGVSIQAERKTVSPDGKGVVPFPVLGIFGDQVNRERHLYTPDESTVLSPNCFDRLIGPAYASTPINRDQQFDVLDIPTPPELLQRVDLSDHVAASLHRVGMVFQEARLLPWKT